MKACRKEINEGMTLRPLAPLSLGGKKSSAKKKGLIYLL